MRRIFILTSFSMMLMLACGSTSETPAETQQPPGDAGETSIVSTGDGEGGLTSVEFDQKAATSLCHAAFSCHCDFTKTYLCQQGCPSSEIDCVSHVLARFAAPGLFHVDRAEACLAQLLAQACNDVPAACDQVYEVLAKPGDPCGSDSDCGGGSFCPLAGFSMQVGNTGGKCHRYQRAKQGEPCMTSCSNAGSFTACTDESTIEGAACWYEDGLRCLNGKCGPLGVDGEVCSSISLECAPDFQCRSGHCVREAVAAGGMCTPTMTICGVHTFCAPEGTCQPAKHGGDPCSTAIECLSDQCSPSGRCTWSALDPRGPGLCGWL